MLAISRPKRCDHESLSLSLKASRLLRHFAQQFFANSIRVVGEPGGRNDKSTFSHNDILKEICRQIRFTLFDRQRIYDNAAVPQSGMHLRWFDPFIGYAVPDRSIRRRLQSETASKASRVVCSASPIAVEKFRQMRGSAAT